MLTDTLDSIHVFPRLLDQRKVGHELFSRCEKLIVYTFDVLSRKLVHNFNSAKVVDLILISRVFSECLPGGSLVANSFR